MKILKTLIIIILVSMIFLPTVHAKSDDKLHIITVAEWSDAMILESNGHYAMIDTEKIFHIQMVQTLDIPIEKG